MEIQKETVKSHGYFKSIKIVDFYQSINLEGGHIIDIPDDCLHDASQLIIKIPDIDKAVYVYGIASCRRISVILDSDKDYYYNDICVINPFAKFEICISPKGKYYEVSIDETILQNKAELIDVKYITLVDRFNNAIKKIVLNPVTHLVEGQEWTFDINIQYDIVRVDGLNSYDYSYIPDGKLKIYNGWKLDNSRDCINIFIQPKPFSVIGKWDEPIMN